MTAKRELKHTEIRIVLLFIAKVSCHTHCQSLTFSSELVCKLSYSRSPSALACHATRTARRSVQCVPSAEPVSTSNAPDSPVIPTFRKLDRSHYEDDLATGRRVPLARSLRGGPIRWWTAERRPQSPLRVCSSGKMSLRPVYWYLGGS